MGQSNTTGTETAAAPKAKIFTIAVILDGEGEKRAVSELGIELIGQDGAEFGRATFRALSAQYATAKAFDAAGIAMPVAIVKAGVAVAKTVKAGMAVTWLARQLKDANKAGPLVPVNAGAVADDGDLLDDEADAA